MISQEKTLAETNTFYSRNWNQKNVFTLSYSRPHYDVLIDDKYLYLINIPNYNYGISVFLLFGFGESYLGDSADKVKREEYRSKWIDLNGNIIYSNFEKDVFLKILVVDLPKFLIYKKNGVMSDGFILNNAGKKMILQNSKKEYVRLLDYLDKIGVKINIRGILN